MERSLQKSYSKSSGFTRTADKHAIQEQCGVREVRGRSFSRSASSFTNLTELIVLNFLWNTTLMANLYQTTKKQLNRYRKLPENQQIYKI